MLCVVVVRSPDDESCLMVSIPNKALSQSFENLLDDNSFGLVHVRATPIHSSPVSLTGRVGHGPLSNKPTDFLTQKFKKDPYITTLSGFSKVTNYIFDAFRGTEEQHQRPPEEVADLLSEVIPVLDINQQEEPGFEVITRVRSHSPLLAHHLT